ncbi:MAG: type II toxin-antitoxin system RelE/ParE family toxin [Clostridia bacterium]|nr:type II toxin-antitoxin system RelE/ParE family toxin [Clostridia bacterium]
MNCKIRLTATAKKDLRDIAVYITEQTKNKNVALEFVKELQEKCKILEMFPKSGSVPQDRVIASLDYRYLVYKSHLLFYEYRKEENTAYILAVFNAKRDYVRVMKKFL